MSLNAICILIAVLLFEVQPAIAYCGGRLYQNSGTIKSPNYPNAYGPNEECNWLITVPTGNQVSLTFQAFQLEVLDYVEVRDGPYLQSPLLARFNGTNVPNAVRSTSNDMFVRFVSDSSVNFKGFTATFTTVRSADKLSTRPPPIHRLTTKRVPCIEGYFCRRNNHCVPPTHFCDGKIDCPDGHDERNCNVTKVADVTSEKLQCVKWFMDRRKESNVHKWGHQLPRTAVALYLADKNFFSINNSTGQEIRYELTVRLLSKIKNRKFLSTEKLALYVHALLVSCLNPRHFRGHDLVSDLRRRVDSSKYASPLAILALCNAGAPMTKQDVQRLRETYVSRHRKYWTEIEVLATMALSCISSKTNVFVDQDLMSEWLSNSGSINVWHNKADIGPRSVALITQLMLGTSIHINFNWRAAVEIISDPTFISSSNFLDKYYVTPAFNNKGLTSITNMHCGLFSDYAEGLPHPKHKMISVRYTVWAKEEGSSGKSWLIQMPSSSTLYDVIMKVQTLDSTHRVKFNVVDGKPYVSCVSGVYEDPEIDYFWFVYKKTPAQELQLLEDGPQDIIVEDNKEFILWYRNGMWNDNGSGELLEL